MKAEYLYQGTAAQLVYSQLESLSITIDVPLQNAHMMSLAPMCQGRILRTVLTWKKISI